MKGRFPIAAFADGLPEKARGAFACFAHAVTSDAVLAHIRSQRGLRSPRAAPPCNWMAG